MHKLFDNDKYKIILTKHFDVHQDWEIPIPGFFIIATRNRKQKSIDEFSDVQAEELTRLTKKLRKGMRDVLGIDTVYIWQNEDTSEWYHLWMFPRHKWMKKFGIKIESVRPIMKYAEKNMVNDKVFEEVEEYAAKMRKYMQNF